MDLMHRRTDKRLLELEKRIAEVFRDALEGLDRDSKDFFDWFSDADKIQKAKLEAGEITEKQYKQWRLDQLKKSDRFSTLRDKLADRMTKANEIALAYVNGDMAAIYAMNRNYGQYELEGLFGNLDFFLWDESTVKRLLEEDPDLLPDYPKELAVQKGIDLEYNRSQITKTITSGILRGQSVQDIASELMTRLQGINYNSAIRAARTAITSAENAGRQDSYAAAAKLGIQVRKRWVATLDGDTRKSHRRLDGETVDWDKPYSNGLMYPGDRRGKPDEVYNCFIGEVKVASDSETIRSYKHMYYGRLVSVKTAGGVKFTCTPNHPILTPSGWVRAESLNNGDNLIVTFARDYAFSGRYPNINRRFSRFDAFHELMNKFGGKRTRALGVNFHGDVAATYVEIVTQERFLRNVGDSSGKNGIDKFLLKLSDKTLSILGSLFEHFRSICKTSFCRIRSSRIFPSFLWRHFGHTNKHAFRPTSNVNISFPEYSIDNLPADTVIRGELLNGLSGNVFVDKIVLVEICCSDCHVYNLQTKSGYYFVNSSIEHENGKCNGIAAIAKNCRCTQRTVEKPGIEAEPRKRRAGGGKLISDMTYTEWERWKESGGN